MVLAAGEALRCVRLRAGWTPQGWVDAAGLGGMLGAWRFPQGPEIAH